MASSDLNATIEREFDDLFNDEDFHRQMEEVFEKYRKTNILL